MNTYIKKIGYRIIALSLAIFISVLVENSYKTIMNKDITEINEKKLIEEILIKSNDEKQIVGFYKEIHPGTTETGMLFIFPDKTWIFVTSGCFGKSLQDKGTWFYNNRNLVLNSDNTLGRTTFGNSVYWLTNISSQLFLFDNADYFAYLDHKFGNMNLEKVILNYSYKKEFFDFSNYKEIKQKYSE